MSSKQLKMSINCLLILSAVLTASGQGQHYNPYNNAYNHPYARQQLVYQYDTPPEKTPPHQYVSSSPAHFPSSASAPFPSAHAPFPSVQAQAQAPVNLSTRLSQALIQQIVQGSEQFTFEMIYVSF